MQVRSRSTGVAATLVLALGLLTVGATPASAVSAPEEVATGLDNPFKLSFGPDGDLYVAEAGIGGSGPCVDAPATPDSEPLEACFGTSGAVTRVAGGDGPQTRVVEGLPSWSTIAEAVGPSDVVVAEDGTLYVVVGLGGNVDRRAGFGDDAVGLGTVLEVGAEGEVTILADLAQWEADNDPDAEEPGAEAVGEGGDSNPYGIEMDGDGSLLVVDAGGNTVLRIADGEVSLEALLPGGEAEAPPFLGLPPATTIPYQFVPTAVRVVDGAILVSELTGFPFPQGEAGVYDVSASALTVVADGFTNIVDFAVDANGNLYVVELAHSSLLAEQPDPRVVQVRPDGTRKALLNPADLQGAPTGITVGPDQQLYLSLGLAEPGAGRVVRFDPTTAFDQATAAACPPAQVPGTTFDDIADAVHREAIECLVWWGAVGGVTADAFRAGDATTRGQVASVLARALETAGVELPASPPDAFDDDDDTTHEDRINQLAALEVVRGFGDGTFRPGAVVTRAQLASMLVRAHNSLFASLPAGPDAFDDDAGNVHEAAINAAANAGWVEGTAARTFDPSGLARRGQMSSMVARMLSTLVAEGEAGLPGAPG